MKPVLRTCALTLLLALPLAAGGCRKPAIEKHQVPKAQASTPAAVQPAQAVPAQGDPETEAKVRLLGALAEHGRKSWFFKVMGPAQAVAGEKDRFDAFVNSLRFTDDPQGLVAWELPKEWKEEPGKGMRYATLRMGSGPAALELSVIPLPGGAGGVLANVNRWRGQLGLDPYSQEQLDSSAVKVQAGGQSVTVVDMTGLAQESTESPFVGALTAPAPTVPGAPVLPAPVATPSAPVKTGITYKAPEGWKELTERDRMHEAAFEIAQGPDRIVVTITPLGAMSGGLPGNVNRWRAQVGLGQIGQDEIQKDLRKIEVGGHAGHFVELIGPAETDSPARAILGVVLALEETTWFFKMHGPAPGVASQKEAFEAFIMSVRFGPTEKGSE